MIYFKVHFQGVAYHQGKPEQAHKEEGTTKKGCLLTCPQTSAQLGFLQDSDSFAER